MALSTLIGEKVIKKVFTTGTEDWAPEEVDTSNFGKDGAVVGLYFTAHWCPPCRAFTPKLAEWYNKLKAGPNGDKFEIFFVSSDRDESSFNEYFKEMPWHAVPFAKREIKNNLSRKFKVSGIPTLVLLEADTCKTITSDGRSIVTDDTEGANFPWKPKPLSELIGDKFISNAENMDEVGKNAIDGKVLGLYFSAHWCGPCRSFTPQLVDSYRKLKDSGKNFEIVFCSSDRDEGSFKEYFGSMPWLSLPFNDARKKALSRHFDVSGIPTLVILDEERKPITAQGRGAVNADPEGKEFPWHPKPLNKLTGATAGQINDNPSLVLFTDGNCEKLKSELEPVATEYVAKWKADGVDQEVCFFYAEDGDSSDDDIVQSLRKFANLPEKGTLLAIIDIPEQRKYISELKDDDMNRDNIKSFLDKYLKKSIEGSPLRSDS